MWIIRIAIAGLVAMLVAAGAARAEDTKAAEVLAAARKAVGEGQLDALKTLRVEATVQRNVGNFQAQSEVELLVELPDKFVRTDVPSGAMGISINSGFNGGRAILPANARVAPVGGAMVITMGGSAAAAHGAERPTPEQLEQMQQAALRNSRHEISRLMLGWFGMTHPATKAEYTYAGEAESPDGRAHIIDVRDGDDFAARLFIDQASNLPLMLTYKGRPPRMMRANSQASREAADKQLADVKAAMEQPQPLVEVTLFFDEWREVEGIRFPHVLRRSSEGTTTEEWSVTKVDLNAKIDAKRFAVESR